jgi:hypothetical protein
MFIAAKTNPWVAFGIAVVLLVLWIVAAMENGTTVTTPGCTLITYRWINRDRCTTTGCANPCIAIKGPFPRFLGPLALFTQDIGCFCSPVAVPGFGTFLQSIFNSALRTAQVTTLYDKLIGLLINEPDSPDAQRLRDLIEKVNNGEDLSEDDERLLEEILSD